MTEYETQRKLVKAHLKRYGSIDALEAFARYRIMRLAAIIHELRKEMPILTEMHYDGRKRWAEYKMPPPVVETEERQEGALPSEFNTLFLGGQL